MTDDDWVPSSSCVEFCSGEAADSDALHFYGRSDGDCFPALFCVILRVLNFELCRIEEIDQRMHAIGSLQTTVR